MKPQRPLSWLESIITANKKSIGEDVVILIGMRGYYRDSMGVKGANDRGIYDDGFFWINLKTGFLASYNGNVDPSRVRRGKGSGSGKGMAQLKPGAWRYKTGMHNGSVPHPAFRQAGDVKIWRDGFNGQYDDVLTTSINIHRGGVNSTSSLGCQTVPPTQWDDFKATGYKLLKDVKQSTFCYILVDQQG